MEDVLLVKWKAKKFWFTNDRTDDVLFGTSHLFFDLNATRTDEWVHVSSSKWLFGFVSFALNFLSLHISSLWICLCVLHIDLKWQRQKMSQTKTKARRIRMTFQKKMTRSKMNWQLGPEIQPFLAWRLFGHNIEQAKLSLVRVSDHCMQITLELQLTRVHFRVAKTAFQMAEGPTPCFMKHWCRDAGKMDYLWIIEALPTDACEFSRTNVYISLEQNTTHSKICITTESMGGWVVLELLKRNRPSRTRKHTHTHAQRETDRQRERERERNGHTERDRELKEMKTQQDEEDQTRVWKM